MLKCFSTVSMEFNTLSFSAALRLPIDPPALHRWWQQSGGQDPRVAASVRATVATGTPEGIWRMLSTESHPSMELLLWMGTPMTGKVVKDAVMPGSALHLRRRQR